MDKDFYEVLGVDKQANQKEIKKNYRKLVMKYHPDKNPDDNEAEEMFKKIASAYEVLSDVDKKAKYDSIGHSDYTSGGSRGRGGNGGFGFGNAEDLINQMRKQQQENRNKDRASLVHKLSLTMEEVYNGVTKVIKYNIMGKCTPCNGKGGEGLSNCGDCNGKGVKTKIINTPQGIFQQSFKCNQCNGKGLKISKICKTCSGNGISLTTKETSINIPQSIMPNQNIVLTNMGSYYKEGELEKYGDLSIIVDVIEDKFIILSNFNLLTIVEVDYTTLVLGGNIEFTTIDGLKLNVPVSKFTTLGRKLKLKGKGLKVGRYGTARADQYVQVELKMPKTLSKKEKELLNELKKVDNN